MVARSPSLTDLWPCCRRRTLSASGTTRRFVVSYAGGTPSNTFSLSIAAAPRLVLCGIMLQARQETRSGLCCGTGRAFHCADVRLARRASGTGFMAQRPA